MDDVGLSMCTPKYSVIKDETFNRYLNDIRNFPLIDHQREILLSDIIFHSNNETEVRKSKHEMACANLRMVVKIAMKYYNRMLFYPDYQASIMDFISEGNIGLTKAVQSYDGTSFKNRFSTYATPYICGKMNQLIQKSRFIRIPANHHRHFLSYAKMLNKYGANIDDNILMDEMKVTANMLENIKREYEEHRIITDHNKHNAIENIASHKKDAYENASQSSLREYLQSKINELNKANQYVISKMFFDNRELSVSEIASRLKVSKQAISRRYKNSLKELRNKINNDKLNIKGELK